MQRPIRIATVIAASAALTFPGTAGARAFRDRVITGAGAHAAQVAGTTQRYPLGDGSTIPITIARSFTGDPAIAQTYATFIGTLPHGSEMASLKVVIVNARRVDATCGGEPGDGIVACYESDSQTMVVPGDPNVSTGGFSAEYVIAHEYGHHLAGHRRNTPLAALDYGPKRWSSYQLVCSRAAAGKLAPGDESAFYDLNPGEAWADTYAHLVFPDVRWRLTPLLKPSAGALAAAAADVALPWTQRTSTTFDGSFAAGGNNVRSFKLPMTLDGAFTLKLSGPQAANYDLVVRSGAKLVGRTTKAGASDRLHYRLACRDRRTETLTVMVVRHSGRGPFSVKASYAG